MPNYDYLCKKCNNKIEIFHKMSDNSSRSCPKCKSKMEKQIGKGYGIIFKGKGFYINDYTKNEKV